MDASKEDYLSSIDIIESALHSKLLLNSFKTYQSKNNLKESYIFDAEKGSFYVMSEIDEPKTYKTTCDFFQVKEYEIGRIEEFKELFKGKRIYKIRFTGLDDLCVKLSKKQKEELTLFNEMNNSNDSKAVLISDKTVRTKDISEESAPIRFISDLAERPFRYVAFLLPIVFSIVLISFLSERNEARNNPLPMPISQLCNYAMQAIGEDGRTECLIRGNRVVYRWYDPERAVWGRWRDHECDERITYSYNSASGNLSFNTSIPECLDIRL
ncbi:MAG: hypothetical protein COC19_02650 [SAR86 cluster bacterium]|uniref:Uncharacterized protein n=1 Tax=SAR86 cluster bacterium TaxID=2030880 RepID=A0A2A4MRN1_9GAMM|nr:MAG: hypothetical protein COC19_02650 [SAR86 cluster bacterium]